MLKKKLQKALYWFVSGKDGKLQWSPSYEQNRKLREMQAVVKIEDCSGKNRPRV